MRSMSLERRYLTMQWGYDYPTDEVLKEERIQAHELIYLIVRLLSIWFLAHLEMQNH